MGRSNPWVHPSGLRLKRPKHGNHLACDADALFRSRTDQGIPLVLVLRLQPQTGASVQHRFHRDLFIDRNHADVTVLNPWLSADDDVIALVDLPVDHTVALYL